MRRSSTFYLRLDIELLIVCWSFYLIGKEISNYHLLVNDRVHSVKRQPGVTRVWLSHEGMSAPRAVTVLLCLHQPIESPADRERDSF